MLLSASSPGVQYAGTFLGALGIYPTIANTITWVSNNTEGVYKRGITMGFVIGWGNLNGVVSSNIYQRKDRPKYRVGHGVVFAYLVLFLMGGSAVINVLLRRENKKRRLGARDYLIEGKTEEEREALGDKRYERFVLFPFLLSFPFATECPLLSSSFLFFFLLNSFTTLSLSFLFISSLPLFLDLFSPNSFFTFSYQLSFPCMRWLN